MATLSSEDRALLRLYVSDPTGPTEVLSDTVLDQLYETNEGSLEGTAARGWRIKAATVAEWYLMNADGAFLSRDQVFAHCIKMAEYYEKLGGTAYAMTNVGLQGPNWTDADASSEF